MKIVQALKTIKLLAAELTPLADNIKLHCVGYQSEKSALEDPKAACANWYKSGLDKLDYLQKLKDDVSRTNLQTTLTIDLPGIGKVTKSVSRWIEEKRQIPLRVFLAKSFDDRKLQPKVTVNSAGVKDVDQVVRHYDPAEPIERLAMLQKLASVIDGELEIVNATTELIEG